MSNTARQQQLHDIIKEKLRPHVRQIDAEGQYPLGYLQALGEAGLYDADGSEPGRSIRDRVRLIEMTAQTCLTSAFNIWCHLAAVTYVGTSDNERLKQEVLPGLLDGRLRGGTGLSNPMKYYAGLDQLYLKAEPDGEGGYRLQGTLPMVSNLGEDHWFAAVAETADHERIVFFLPCTAQGLHRTERVGYLGLNGSATYACVFNQVEAGEQWVLSQDADSWIRQVRSIFILYQIPLGLGLVNACIETMRKSAAIQGGCSQYLAVQPEHLEEALIQLRERTYMLAVSPSLSASWSEVLKLRLQTVHLTLQAAQAAMLFQGSAGYQQNSGPARRLREAYFYANLTPSVRHLEKLNRLLSNQDQGNVTIGQ
ncbi:acyl-CoA dehydrogenase family protein [Paenibacillus daejeonensis]|uniref:acyl-CoA dehydrogenase family protein n=1 Tax=Paenibacillus daejeonensis TaxID=135193 RepID=UPI000380DF8E|nr:acyl-CoA dehydrogenase family protein [Paenibacillus daejeonensis]